MGRKAFDPKSLQRTSLRLNTLNQDINSPEKDVPYRTVQRETPPQLYGKSWEPEPVQLKPVPAGQGMEPRQTVQAFELYLLANRERAPITKNCGPYDDNPSDTCTAFLA